MGTLLTRWEQRLVAEDRSKGFSFLLFCVAYFLCYPPYATLFVVMGATPPGIALYVLAPIILLAPAVAWATRRLAPGASVICCTTFAAIITVSHYSGGIFSPAMYWFTVIPAAALFVGGPRAAVAWCSVAVAVAGFLYAHTHFGWATNLLSLEQTLLINFLSVSGAVTFSLTIVVVQLRQADLQLRRERTVSQELTKARQTAEAASKAKSRFLANVSHEVRTPMNGVLGMSEILIETPLTTDQQEMAQTIRESSMSLLGILDDILDVSKIEANQMKLDPTDFELHGLLSSVNTLMGASVSQKKIQMELDIDFAAPTLVIGDALRLKQILTNLIGNAVKFTSHGTVTLRCRRLDADRYLFEVEDTGIGIPADRLPQLFQPFTQADDSTTRKFGGTGLGLAISRNLVLLMGGELKVTSQVGLGSRFYFTISLPEGHYQATEPAESSQGEDLAVSCSVLVVDDVPVNRIVAQRMLERFGCKVETADNGAEAFEAIRLGCFDLVLMDCHMPVMDGFQASAAIRAQWGDAAPPIVALTASVDDASRASCQQVGMKTLLRKPVQLDALGAVLKTYAAVER